MWSFFKRNRKQATPEEIITDFAKAWEKADADLIVKHLADGFLYDSQWVYDGSLDCKKYAEYIRSKFATSKKNSAMPSVSIVPTSPSSAKQALQLSQGGNFCYYCIRIEGGKVVKGDMCAAVMW